MDIEQLLGKYREIIPLYSQSRSYRTYLEEYKKSLLSILMKEAEKEGHKTGTSQEREAYANQRYITHLETLSNAVKDDEYNRYTVRQLEMEIEIWRTNQANNRMERKAYGA